MNCHASTLLTGASLLFVVASTASAQNVAQITKNGGNLVIDANDIRFNRGGSYGKGDVDTVQGWVGEMGILKDTFSEALATFKTEAIADVDTIYTKSKKSIDVFKEEAVQTTLKATDAELDAAYDALNDSLNGQGGKKDSFAKKFEELQERINAQLKEYKALKTTVGTKLQSITTALEAEEKKAGAAQRAFAATLAPKIDVVVKELGDKKSDTTFFWAGGTTRSAGSGWGWLGLDRVDIAAQGDQFVIEGNQYFVVRKPGLYRLSYQGIQRGSNCNGYALVQLNNQWISAHHYNKHISGWSTRNPQNVDFTWKYREGDKIRLYLYDCQSRIYGSRSGRLDSANRVSFSFEGLNKADMIAK